MAESMWLWLPSWFLFMMLTIRDDIVYWLFETLHKAKAKCWRPSFACSVSPLNHNTCSRHNKTAKTGDKHTKKTMKGVQQTDRMKEEEKRERTIIRLRAWKTDENEQTSGRKREKRGNCSQITTAGSEFKDMRNTYY